MQPAKKSSISGLHSALTSRIIKLNKEKKAAKTLAIVIGNIKKKVDEYFYRFNKIKCSSLSKVALQFVGYHFLLFYQLVSYQFKKKKFI